MGRFKGIKAAPASNKEHDSAGLTLSQGLGPFTRRVNDNDKQMLSLIHPALSRALFMRVEETYPDRGEIPQGPQDLDGRRR